MGLLFQNIFAHQLFLATLTSEVVLGSDIQIAHWFALIMMLTNLLAPSLNSKLSMW